jgi:hypothetical protein
MMERGCGSHCSAHHQRPQDLRELVGVLGEVVSDRQEAIHCAQMIRERAAAASSHEHQGWHGSHHGIKRARTDRDSPHLTDRLPTHVIASAAMCSRHPQPLDGATASRSATENVSGTS